MTPVSFKRSLRQKRPPPDLSSALCALWWLGKDDWRRAHELVMSSGGVDCAWVHAHLHRLEGDLDNARYWYRQAGRGVATGQPAEEWTAIVVTLLGAPRSGSVRR
jgi:hypothetical protein